MNIPEINTYFIGILIIWNIWQMVNIWELQRKYKKRRNDCLKDEK